MSSQKSTPLSTPIRKKTPRSIMKSNETSKISDENIKPGGTPLSHFKSNVKSSSTSSPKTPFTSHNRTNKSPQPKSFLRSITPKNVSNGQVVRPSILKNKGSSTAPSTPKQTPSSSRATTPKTTRTFKSPIRCTTPVKVDNSVLVQFSKDIFSDGSENFTPIKPAQSLNDLSPDPYNMFDRLNRSHSASSLFRLKKKDEETPKTNMKRSLSEAKLSLNSSIEPEGEKSSLTVGVRVRPLLPREGMNGINVSDGEVKVASDLGSEHSFTYDHCFPCTATQEEVYEALVRPLLDNAFEGYNACLFAYGQTGSGKTYSMMGPSLEEGEEACLKEESGMIPRFCSELLERKSALEEANPSITMTVKVSYLEVYNEKIHDLLVPENTQLRVREHPVYGPYVVDLSQHSVNSFQEFQHWMTIGNKKRAVAATEQNDKSSRSHSLFTIKLTQSFAQLRSDGSWSHDQTRRSQINLVDLAGSERIANSTVSSDRLREGVSINRSLLTLGKVMSALVDKRGFVPYRESVLTWLLKESLGGNSRTCMLATVSPCSNHMDESLSTLRYASQARAIINRVRVNEAPQDREIRQLREEVERLRGAGERIHTLLGENEILREKLKDQEDLIKELEDELNKYKINLSKVEEMKMQLMKEISDLSVSNESEIISNEDVNKYESQIMDYKEKLTILQEAYDSLKEELKFQESLNKQKELHSMKEAEQVGSLQEEIKQLKKQLQNYEEDLADAQLKNVKLKNELNEKEHESFKMNRKVKENEDRINDLERDIKALQDEFKNSQSSLIQTNKINESLNKKVEELIIKEEILKQDLNQIPALESALSDFEKELRQCKDDLFDARKCKEDLESTGKELKDELQKTKKTLADCLEREELLKIKLEKIPTLESELRLAEAEARKAKRELEEYLSQSIDSDDGNGNSTIYQSDGQRNDSICPTTNNLLNDSRYPIENENESETDLVNELQKELVSQKELESEKNQELNALQTQLDYCKSQLQEVECINDKLLTEMSELRAEKESIEEQLSCCKNDSFLHQEKVINLQEQLVELNELQQKLKSAKEHISTLENDLTKLKEQLKEEKRNRSNLEEKLAESNLTIKHLKLKADNAVHFEIELGKCREALQKLESSHMRELAESKSREEVIKAELALKNQQMDHLKNQLSISQDMQKNLTHENQGLIKLLKKKCNETEPSKPSTDLLEKNIGLKKDIAILKEKLSEKEKHFVESQSLLKQVIQHEIKHEKALLKAKLDCAAEVFDYTMDAAYPHHLNYLIRKARKFTETYKIPYEFEFMEKCVLVKHLLLSAKATLSHLHLSNWIEKIETEKVWNQNMDKDFPWEVDFRDYYDKNVILKPSEEDSTEADNAINCGVQVTAAGCINPILWRKTMVKRHVLGIKEDSDVLIRYFNEIEDSRIYSILSRIQVAVARLQEATQNVEK